MSACLFIAEPYEDYVDGFGKLTSNKVATVVKQDSAGYILDPFSMKFKCSRGKTLSDATKHFMERNPTVKTRLL